MINIKLAKNESIRIKLASWIQDPGEKSHVGQLVSQVTRREAVSCLNYNSHVQNIFNQNS